MVTGWLGFGYGVVMGLLLIIWLQTYQIILFLKLHYGFPDLVK